MALQCGSGLSGDPILAAGSIGQLNCDDQFQTDTNAGKIGLERAIVRLGDAVE